MFTNKIFKYIEYTEAEMRPVNKCIELFSKLTENLNVQYQVKFGYT